MLVQMLSEVIVHENIPWLVDEIEILLPIVS